MAGALRKPRTYRNKRAAAKQAGGARLFANFAGANSLRGPERKTVDLSIVGPTATIAAAAGTASAQDLTTGFICLNLCQAGDTANSRDGNIVAMQSIAVSFTVQAGANTELSDAQVRSMVVVCSDWGGGNQVMSSLLGDISETGAATTTFASGVSPLGVVGCRVMRDIVTTVSKISGPSPSQHVQMIIPLKGLPVRYSGSANPMTIAYILNNAVFFIAFGRMTGAGTLPAIVNFKSRYIFTER